MAKSYFEEIDQPLQSVRPEDWLDKIIERQGMSAHRPLVRAIFQQESSGGKANTANPNASGARGPMQIKEITFKDMQQRGLIPKNYRWDNPEHSAEAGVAYLKYALDRYGDEDKAAAFYFSGPKVFDRSGNIIETRAQPGGKTVGQYIQDIRRLKAEIAGPPAPEPLKAQTAGPPAPEPQPQQEEKPKKPTWQQIISSDAYQKAGGEEREAVRQAFFDQVIAPDMATEDIEAARAEFDRKTAPRGFLEGVSKGFTDTVKRIWHRDIPSVGLTMRGVALRQADRALSVMDKIDAGGVTTPEQIKAALSEVGFEDPRQRFDTLFLARQYMNAGPEARAKMRETILKGAEKHVKAAAPVLQKMREFEQAVRAENAGRAPLGFTDINWKDPGTWQQFKQWAGEGLGQVAASMGPTLLTALITRSPTASAAASMGQTIPAETAARIEHAQKQAKDRYAPGEEPADKDKETLRYAGATAPASVTSGAVQGVLDIAAGPVGMALKKAAGKTVSQVIKEAPKTVFKSGVGESFVEGSQEGVSIGTERLLGEQGGDALSEQNVKRVIDAAAIGLIGGKAGSIPVIAADAIRAKTAEEKASNLREIAKRLRNEDQPATEKEPIKSSEILPPEPPATPSAEGAGSIQQPETAERASVASASDAKPAEAGAQDVPPQPPGAPPAEPAPLPGGQIAPGPAPGAETGAQGIPPQPTSEPPAAKNRARGARQPIGPTPILAQEPAPEARDRDAQPPRRLELASPYDAAPERRARRKGLKSRPVRSEYDANRALEERAKPGWRSPSGKTVEEVFAAWKKRKESEPAKEPKKKLFGLFSRKAVETPQFKRWFGASKVRDSAGPKVYYHGTAQDIERFAPRTSGAIFLSPDPKFAETFSHMSLDYLRKSLRKMSGKKLSEIDERARARVRENMKDDDPETVQYYLDNVRMTDEWFEEALDAVETGPNIMPVYARAETPFDYDNRQHVGRVLNYVFRSADNVSLNTPGGRVQTNVTRAQLESDLLGGSWPAIESAEVQKAIRDLGHDSFYVREGGVKNLAVYNPQQIKSATGNTGEFSESPLITKSVAEPKAGEPARGLRVPEVKALVSLFAKINRGADKLDIKVYQRAEDVPDVGLKSGDAEGFYDGVDGSVVIIASELDSIERAAEVLLHEIVGHHGVEAVIAAAGPGFEKRWVEVLNDVARVRAKGGYASMESVANTYKDAPRLVQAMEVLARMAEKGESHTLLTRAISILRDALRALGFRLKMSESDIRELITRARLAVLSGENMMTEETRAWHRKMAEGGLDAEPQFSKKKDWGQENAVAEVAPGSDAAIKPQWDALPFERRREITDNIAKRIAPQVAALFTTNRVEVATTRGGREGGVNPSFVTKIDGVKPETAKHIAAAIAYALDQDAGMHISKAGGADSVVVVLESGQDGDALYKSLPGNKDEFIGFTSPSDGVLEFAVQDAAASAPKLAAHFAPAKVSVVKRDSSFFEADDYKATLKTLNDAERATLDAIREQARALMRISLSPKRKGKQVSTAHVTARTSWVNPIEQRIVVGLDQIFGLGPDGVAVHAALMEKMPNIRPKNGRTAKETIEAAVEHFKTNLLWLYDKYPEKYRELAKRWYEGANKIARGFADKYGVAEEQAAGVIAALSPQRDWYINVSLAARVLDAWTKHKESNFAATELMYEAATADRTQQTAAAREAQLRVARRIRNKKLSELKDLVEAAAWIRAYDETHNSPAYHILGPDGSVAGVAKDQEGGLSAIQWGSIDSIANAISILKDGSIENISRSLGDGHKVRSFYSDIIDPSDSDVVTVDTHAISAATLRPLTSDSPEVRNLFGGNEAGERGPATSAIIGSNGTYGIFHEAVVRAAKERDVLPRELQSVTWEAIRQMFPARSKAALLGPTTEIWMAYKSGKKSLDQVHKELMEVTNGFEEPSWAQLGTGVHEKAQHADEAVGLPRPVVDERDVRGDAASRGPGRRHLLRSAPEVKEGSDAGGFSRRPPPQTGVTEADRSGIVDGLFKLGFEWVGKKITEPAYDFLVRSAESALPEKVKHGIISNYGLPSEYLEVRTDRTVAINKSLREAKNLLDALASLDREQLRIAYLWMSEKPDPALERDLMERLPAESRAILRNMKNLVDKLGQDAVKAGLLTKESYERNRMAYLHRSYEAHMKSSAESASTQMKHSIAIRAENFKGRGLRHDVPDDALIQHVDEVKKGDLFVRYEALDSAGRIRKVEYLPPSAEAPPGYRNAGVWEARFFDKKKSVGLWRDLTKEERQKLGEIEEVRFAFAKTVLASVRDIETARFFKWVANNYAFDQPGRADEEMLSDSGDASPASGKKLPSTAKIITAPETGYLSTQTFSKDDYVIVPDTNVQGTNIKKYGALAGKLVPGAIWNDIRTQLARPESDIAQLYDTVMRGFKISKALALDTPIPTPDGWTTMGDLKPGDTVFDEVGEPCKVLQATETQYDHQCYEVEFSDGSKIVADAGHLWFTYYKGIPEVMETREILDTIRDEQGKCNHAVPIADPLALPDKEVPVHPYILGVWLGGRGLASKKAARQSALVAAARDSLRKLGVTDDKHIPVAYLRASPRQRRDLLTGLMDAGGQATSGASVFTTASERVMAGALELLRSLGYAPTLDKDKLSGYKIRFAPRGMHMERRVRMITSIKEVQSVPVRCILVSSPSHLFLAGEGMVPTHNTALTPAVHMNNVMANFVLADLANIRARDIVKALQTALAASRGDKEAQAMLDRYQDSGAEAGAFMSVEIRGSYIEPLLKEIEDIKDNELGLVKVSQIVDLAAHGELSAAAKAAKHKLSPAAIPFSAMMKLYQTEDTVFRLAKFLREVQSGKTDRQAGALARESFLDYNINAPWVQFARRTALPFIAFSYRAIPLVIKRAAQQPWKLAKYYVVGHALNAAAYALVGGEEERERRLLPDELSGELFGIFPRLLRMPWNDKHDSPVFLDMRRWVPGGDMLDLSMSKAAIPVPSWLSVAGPLSIMMEFFSNRSALTGKPIVKETDDETGEIAVKVLDHLFKAFAPNLPLPGPGTLIPDADRGALQTYAWQSIVDAGSGRLDAFGRDQSLTTALLSSIGVKAKAYPEDYLAAIAVSEFRAQADEIRRNMTAYTRELSRKGISEDLFIKKMEAERKKLERASERLRKKLGAEADQAID